MFTDTNSDSRMDPLQVFAVNIKHYFHISIFLSRNFLFFFVLMGENIASTGSHAVLIEGVVSVGNGSDSFKAYSYIIIYMFRIFPFKLIPAKAYGLLPGFVTVSPENPHQNLAIF